MNFLGTGAGLHEGSVLCRCLEEGLLGYILKHGPEAAIVTFSSLDLDIFRSRRTLTGT